MVDEADVRPTLATKKFRTSLEFADRSDKVFSARTFFYESEQQCDRNLETFLNSIDAVSSSTQNEGFTAVKLTALGRPQLLVCLHACHFYLYISSYKCPIFLFKCSEYIIYWLEKVHPTISSNWTWTIFESEWNGLV